MILIIFFVCLQTGFPFDESEYDTGDRLQSTLDDIAQRHPEFADHLTFDRFPSWRRKRFGSGSSNDKEEPPRDPQRTQAQGQSSRTFDTPDRRFGDHSFPSGFNRFPFTHHFDDFGDDISSEKPPEVPRTQERKARKVVNPNLPQHLSNTVDLGQKQAPIEESRGQRSMSAPPENRTCRNSSERDMGSYLSSRPNRTQPSPTPQNNPRERIIPIHVEGRDEPILPKNINIEIQRPDPNEVHPNFHQQAAPKYHTPPTSHQAPPPQHKQTPPTQKPHEETPPPPQPSINKNDPLEKIKLVKSDVLELMQQVENYIGTRKDKLYAYLDEMLTLNLLKLDNVETEGKDNIRTARKEAIKCIEECISKLEAKALANEKKMAANESTKVEETQEKPSETCEIDPELKKSESKPKFKSTASIELHVPSESGDPQMEIQSGATQTENPSQESMEIEKQNTNIQTSTENSKMELENPSDETKSEKVKDVSDSSQNANETNK